MLTRVPLDQLQQIVTPPSQSSNHPRLTMSAPKQGRQSPEPEQSSHAQVGVPESGKIDAAPTATHAKDASEDKKANDLPSNPEGPMEGPAHEKVSKEGRGVA